MKAKTSNLSGKKHRAIAALLDKPSIREAAESVGVGETTVHRWLSDDAFQAVYRQAKQQIVGQSISRLQKASGKAVDALIDIFVDKDKPTSARVTAARTVLDMSVKAVEFEDLQARIEKIEKILLNEKKGKR